MNEIAYDLDRLREAADRLRGGKVLSLAFEGEPPNRFDEGSPPWEYHIAFDAGQYCLEIARWTRYVCIPATLYEPPEVGWENPRWDDLASPVLAELFDKLAWEGLPLPP